MNDKRKPIPDIKPREWALVLMYFAIFVVVNLFLAGWLS